MHGGDIDAARTRYPDAPEPWLDLSTGINPIPYPPPHLAQAVWSRLPLASEIAELMRVAAQRYGVPDAASIVAAPGTQALIQLLPLLRPRGRVAVIGHTYQEHEACWRRAGHSVAIVPTLDEAATADVVIVVNPDNPTGRLLPKSELARMASMLAQRDGLLVIDEAFADVLSEDASIASDPPSGAVVLRSFGKMYGLAGLRLGFAIAARPLALRLRENLGPWAVSGPAIAVATAALRDEQWLAVARGRLASDAARLDRLLGTAGFELLGGTPLFRLVRHKDAAGIADTLGRQGILVRTFPATPVQLRCGLPGTEGDWQRLVTALAQTV